MSQFTVNGKEVSLEIPPQTPLKDLIDHLLKKMTNDQTVISTIRVNGMELGTELTPHQEQEFGSIPFSDLESIDVETTFSRELVDDTLQHLLQYSTFLSSLSISTAALLADKEFHSALRDLVDGVTTLAEGISSVRQMLRITGDSPAGTKIAELESELLSLLEDLYASYLENSERPLDAGNHNHSEAIRKVLENRLPSNLNAWRDEGIPGMIRLSSS